MTISLCGFMACGKSTVGKKLSAKTGMECIDTDQYLVDKYQMSINEFFAKFGEEKFREAETECVKELCEKDNIILSLGGGVLKKQENIDVLKDKTTLVFVDTPFGEIYKRLATDTTRPLIKGKTKDEVYEMYMARYPMYDNNADIKVENLVSSAKICEKILDKLGL